MCKLLHPSSSIIIFTFLFLLSPFALATNLIVYLHPNNSVLLEALYTTLGTSPNISLKSPFTIISAANISNECVFKGMNTHSIFGHILIFDGLIPPLYGCNRHLAGPSVALAKMAQSHGAAAVFTTSQETFNAGRMAGINPAIHIPFLVIPPTTMKYLSENVASISSLEIRHISPSEQQTVSDIMRNYHGLRFATAALYFIAIVLLGYILYLDIAVVRHIRRKRFSHSIAMKTCGLAACVAACVWLLVDPFSFKSYPGWYPYMCMKLHTGFFTIDFVLILRLSGKAASKATKTLIPYKLLLWFIYPFILIMAVLMFVAGVLWFYPAIVYTFYVIQITILAACGLGFLLYGVDIWKILRHSGNATARNSLPLRIVIFIFCYLIEVYAGNCINLAGSLGLVFGLLFNYFMNGLAFVVIFLILFFQPSKSRRPSYAGGSPTESPEPSPTNSIPKQIPTTTPLELALRV